MKFLIGLVSLSLLVALGKIGVFIMWFQDRKFLQSMEVEMIVNQLVLFFMTHDF